MVFRGLILLVFLVAALVSSAKAQDLAATAQGCKGPPAFPGALGWGQCATGWRGGQIIKVINTNDTGAGSLRNCVEDTGGLRICLFDVGGTIEINQPLSIADGDLYIAGQSAPEDSGGIQIRLAATNASQPTLQVLQADHVLIRHLRLRPGPGQVSNQAVDALRIRNGRHVMLDHLSLAYATDENFDITADNFAGLAPIRGIARFITLQRSILAFGLHNSNHPSAPHSKGALLCAMNSLDFTDGDRCGYVTLYGNYFAHNNDRNPELVMTGEPFEVVNNIMYNPASAYLEMNDEIATAQINIIGNAAFEGSNTTNSPAPHMVRCRDDLGNGATIECESYLFGNIDEDNRSASNAGLEDDVVDDTERGTILTAPTDGLTGALIRAEDLATILLPDVGATKPARDALDTLVVGHCCPGNAGSRVDDPTDVTGTGLTDGYPTLAAGTAETDTDGDGMPDAWEVALDGNQFWVTRQNAWGDRDADGWSNLEEYLNFRAGDIADPRL